MVKKNNYQRFVFPFLSKIDAETAHSYVLSLLSLAQRTKPGRAVLSKIAGEIPSKPTQLFGLNFPNILGVAAGFDKEGNVAPGLSELGFGHIEIGTITPRPQLGNPKPRIFRLAQDEALINRMGFPSSGVTETVKNLDSYQRRDFILGVSLGKQKETRLADAFNDYLTVLRAVFLFADYVAVNISSPNTPELRQLQGKKYLGELIGTLTAENNTLSKLHGVRKRPLLVKIAPDLTLAEVDEMLQVILDGHVDGLIATNTTISRDGLKDDNGNEIGGLSGPPLFTRSNLLISHIAKETNSQLPIIGVGGIRSGSDVRAKLDAGASLVQLYTALVYEGPGIAGHILRDLK